MTPQEFKAWFEGYSEGIDGPPSQRQWTRIKARVAEINGVVTTHTVFMDRYYPQYFIAPHYIPPGGWGQVLCSSGAAFSGVSNMGLLMNSAAPTDAMPIVDAFAQLGAMDARADLTAQI